MRIEPFNAASLALAVEILSAGGVVAHATETCYGLACDLRSIDAVTKLFTIKNRPLHQPVSGLFPSVDEAKKYVTWNDRAEELSKHLPGPLTIILPLRSDTPNVLHPTAETPILNSTFSITLGIRVSSHPHAQALATAASFPITTTSANIHGQPNPYSAEEIAAQFASSDVQPDLILDSGVLPPTPPSTVIDCSKDKPEERRKGKLHICIFDESTVKYTNDTV